MEDIWGNSVSICNRGVSHSRGGQVRKGRVVDDEVKLLVKEKKRGIWVVHTGKECK